jgi:hypothetical protein
MHLFVVASKTKGEQSLQKEEELQELQYGM